MNTTLTMTPKELDRVKIISQITAGILTVADGATSLRLSERQMYRILHRYRSGGDAALLHTLRGRPSNRGFGNARYNEVLQLYRTRYADYGPTLFSEMLAQSHGIHISVSTATRYLRRAGILTAERRKRPHRKKRERRSALGALVQFDGSDHDWFEGRGEKCCLLNAVDDASGRVFMRFARSENVRDVFVCLRLYIERYGIPAALYTDFGSVYQTSDKQQTQYKRAMAALNVECIFAHSPEAKGRVERSHRTHQDRLIKALRRENISTIEEANQYLEQTYLHDHNTSFASTDGLADVHRSTTPYNLDNIFCWEETRHVYNDWTISFNAQYLQLQRSDAPLPPPRANVVVRRWLDDSLHIFWNNDELAYTQLKVKPKPFPRVTCHPPSSHPWKHKVAIGKAKTMQPWKSSSPPKFVSSY